MLRILSVKNYCQHKGERRFELFGRTIGIVGPNGSGKSNLARAISDSLTGKYHKPKNRIITSGQTEGWTELTFDAGDRTLRVHRDLHSKDAEVVDVITGCVLADSARVANQVIQESLHVPQEILEGIVFVEQEDINDLLFAKDAERERIAQSFFGVSAARDIESILGGILSGVPQDFDPALPQEVDDIKARIKGIDDEVKILGKMIQDGSKELLPEETREDYMEMIRTTNLVIDATERLQHLNKQLDRIQAGEDQAIEQIKEANYVIGGRTKKDIETRIERVVKIQGDNATRAMVEERRLVLTRNLDKIRDDIRDMPDVDKLGREHTEILSRRAALLSIVQAREGLLGRDFGTGADIVCPVCFSFLEEGCVPLMSDQNKADNCQLDLMADQYSTLVDRQSSARELRNQCVNKMHSIEHQLEDIRIQLCKLPPTTVGAGADQEGVLRRELVEFVTLLSHKEMLEQHVRSLGSERAVVEDAIEKANRALTVRSYTLEDIQRASVEVDLDNVRLAELRRIEGDISAKSQVRLLMVESLVEKRRKLEEQRKNAAIRDFLAKVRSRFHYTGAPKRVIQSRSSMIGDRINYYLDLLGTRYRVEVRDGLRFQCLFPEKILDSAELSGGEKVDLSNSFRLASTESFCSRIGFMIMDEPTAWLDNRTVDRMAAVVERLSEIGEETGQQFLFVTHSESLVPFFDQVIELQ